jgi:hypothetical protein
MPQKFWADSVMSLIAFVTSSKKFPLHYLLYIGSANIYAGNGILICKVHIENFVSEFKVEPKPKT